MFMKIISLRDLSRFESKYFFNSSYKRKKQKGIRFDVDGVTQLMETPGSYFKSTKFTELSIWAAFWLVISYLHSTSTAFHHQQQQT